MRRSPQIECDAQLHKSEPEKPPRSAARREVMPHRGLQGNWETDQKGIPLRKGSITNKKYEETLLKIANQQLLHHDG